MEATVDVFKEMLDNMDLEENPEETESKSVHQEVPGRSHGGKYHSTGRLIWGQTSSCRTLLTAKETNTG
jgi:hypothetical protein